MVSKFLGFNSVLAQYDPTVLDAVRRASKQSAAAVHQEMTAGLYDLATIASIAPWIGIFGTIVGIVNCFTGFEGEKTTIMAAIRRCLSWSLWFTALGLVVGLVAMLCYQYLWDRLRNFDRDMENSTLELLNQLGRFPNRFTIDLGIEQRAGRSMFGELPLDEVAREERDFRRCSILAGIAVVRPGSPIHPALLCVVSRSNLRMHFRSNHRGRLLRFLVPVLV